jgi:rhomboid protease GluP
VRCCGRFTRVLDLNQILLFIACLSPVVVLARTWRRAALNRNWQVASLAVLSATGAAWVIAPESAGFVGGGAWLLLLFVPAWGLRKAADFAAAQRYGAARRCFALVSLLHPFRRLFDEGRLLRAMELAQRGRREEALQMLATLGAANSRLSATAIGQSYRLRGDWEGLLNWCERHIPRVGLGEETALLPLYFRALGELDRRDDLVLQFAGRAPMLLAAPIHQHTFTAGLAMLLAFGGRTQALVRLFERDAAQFPEDVREFWTATAEAAAGDLSRARTRLDRLARSTSDAIVRADALQRLARRGQLAPLPLTPYNEATVDRFAQHARRRRALLLMPYPTAVTPAVLILLALNGIMFALEMTSGGSTDYIALHRLGALEPRAILFFGQYWRLLTALFLHYGAVHLFVNSYALFMLGPRLETVLGTRRFFIAYLLCGLGSSVAVVLCWRLGITRADLLVGASGAVMGIVGVWAGVLLGHRHMPVARRQLINIAIIIVVQSAFDLYFPQVSMSAHLGGLITGLVIGVVIRPKREL